MRFNLTLLHRNILISSCNFHTQISYADARQALEERSRWPDGVFLHKLGRPVSRHRARVLNAPEKVIGPGLRDPIVASSGVNAWWRHLYRVIGE
ncbi:hypothetical protein [Sodalis sp. RH23]|uniref:hypothetical protein n=1 Tax=unclassified Sodalis (in: enterobacteria) TaxID=2636512 RepID=UPI0039B3B4F3